VDDRMRTYSSSPHVTEIAVGGGLVDAVASVGAPSRRCDVKKNLACPCGEMLRGDDEDDLVAKAQAHLREKHPDKAEDYTRDMILFMAY
jgi:hypothetical protein